MYNAVTAVRTAKKDPAAVALGRRGGKKGGPARAVKLTPKQRSESARKAVQARWKRTKEDAANTRMEGTRAATSAERSDQAVLALLKRLKATNDPTEVRHLSDQLERAIFHKQFKSA